MATIIRNETALKKWYCPVEHFNKYLLTKLERKLILNKFQVYSHRNSL